MNSKNIFRIRFELSDVSKSALKCAMKGHEFMYEILCVSSFLCDIEYRNLIILTK